MRYVDSAALTAATAALTKALSNTSDEDGHALSGVVEAPRIRSAILGAMSALLDCPIDEAKPADRRRGSFW